MSNTGGNGGGGGGGFVPIYVDHAGHITAVGGSGAGSPDTPNVPINENGLEMYVVLCEIRKTPWAWHFLPKATRKQILRLIGDTDADQQRKENCT